MECTVGCIINVGLCGFNSIEGRSSKKPSTIPRELGRREPKQSSQVEQPRILLRIKRYEAGTGDIDVSNAFNESDDDEVANCEILIFGTMGGLS